MKKFMLFATIFIAFATQAQEKIGIGIKVGQNFTSVNSPAVDRHSASFHGGVAFQIGLTEKISLVPELLLSQTKLSTNPSNSLPYIYFRFYNFVQLVIYNISQ